MKKRENIDFDPDVIGLDWAPGNLILVASHPGCGKSQYVLGNCIVAGTKEEVPVAYFLPRGDSFRILKALVRLQAGPEAFDSGRIQPKDIKELPLSIDDTPDMTIAYVVNRLFHLSETKGIQLAVIDELQGLDTSQLVGGTRERELNAALRILKSVADALGIVIIVKSTLSDHHGQQDGLPTVRDILDVTEATIHCDQILLFHRVEILKGYYKMILPMGHPFFKDDGREMVLNLILDNEAGCFRKAESLFEDDEAEPRGIETPMYEWYRDKLYGDWHFEFLDSKGMGWRLTISPFAESEGKEYDIDADNWAGDHISIATCKPCDDPQMLKAFALREARRLFPEVEIPTGGSSSDVIE